MTWVLIILLAAPFGSSCTSQQVAMQSQQACSDALQLLRTDPVNKATYCINTANGEILR